MSFVSGFFHSPHDFQVCPGCPMNQCSFISVAEYVPLITCLSSIADTGNYNTTGCWTQHTRVILQFCGLQIQAGLSLGETQGVERAAFLSGGLGRTHVLVCSVFQGAHIPWPSSSSWESMTAERFPTESLSLTLLLPSSNCKDP